jgi:hypothetical protein
MDHIFLRKNRWQTRRRLFVPPFTLAAGREWVDRVSRDQLVSVINDIKEIIC